MRKPPGYRAALGCLLTSLLLLSTLSPLAGAKSVSYKAPQRDFLPPVASINGKLPAEGATSAGKEGDAIEPVTLSAIMTPVVKTTPPIIKLDTDLGVRSSSEDFQTLSHIQRELDDADLTKLWEATVEKNPVIRFSLEKLATPTDLQKKKSSLFLNKTLNVLLSGATIAATMAPGGTYYRNMGAMAGRDAIQNIMNGKTQPQGEGLSPTEQIQLAGLVDELQGKLLRSYQDYKSALQAMVNAHAITAKNSTLYNNALASGNEFAIVAAGNSYYKALLTETSIRQKAKMARLQLERLAGAETVSDLRLTLSTTTTASAAPMEQAATPITHEESPSPSNTEVPVPPAPEPEGPNP